MPDRRRVLIVGGGIAGLALAPMLARTGVAVEVIEREPAWRLAGTGIYLPGNAARALRALGLEAQVASRAVEIARQRFFDHHGRLLFEVDVAELWAAVGPCLALRRAELRTILRDAAGDVPIRIGLALERLAQRDGIVSVGFSDGTSGEHDLVVGADGIHSAVRRLTFEPTAVPRPVGQVGWRFLAPRPPGVTTWSVMLGRGTAFLTLPVDGDRVYCYCDVVSPRAHDTPERRPPQRLSELFSEFADPAATLLDALDPAADIHVSTIEEVALDRWARRADRRRSPRDLTEHGPRRGDGTRGRTRAHRLLAQDSSDPRRHHGVPRPSPTQNRLGPRPDPPPRPHPLPPPDDQGQCPATPRPANLPRQLPSAAGPALSTDRGSLHVLRKRIDGDPFNNYYVATEAPS
jgi:FAD-dependent urate hydroxylase